MVQGPQKQCSQVSDVQMHKYKYTNTQIHKYAITQIHQYSAGQSCRLAQHVLYFWKCNGTRTSKTMFPSVWRANTQIQIHNFTQIYLVPCLTIEASRRKALLHYRGSGIQKVSVSQRGRLCVWWKSVSLVHGKNTIHGGWNCHHDRLFHCGETEKRKLGILSQRRREGDPLIPPPPPSQDPFVIKHLGTLFLKSSYHYIFKNIAHAGPIRNFDQTCICVFVYLYLCICTSDTWEHCSWGPCIITVSKI